MPHVTKFDYSVPDSPYASSKGGKAVVRPNGAGPGVRNASHSIDRSKPIEPGWSLAFFAILSYLFVEYTRLPSMYPRLQSIPIAKLLVVLTAVGLLTSARPQSNQRQSSSSGSLDLAILAFLGACILSALFSGLSDMQSLIGMITWAVIYFLISRTLTGPWRLRIFILLLLLLCLKLSQFEIRDYVTQQAFGRSADFLDKHGVGAGSSDFFGNGEDFGVAMCVVWPLAGSLFFGERKKLVKLFLLVCFVSFMISIFLCGSRGAVLGAAVAAMTLWVTNPKRIVGAAMVLFFVLGTFYFLPGATGERMRSALHPNQDETAQMRFSLWGAGIHMFEDHPLFGVGIGNFSTSYLNDYNGQTLTPTVFVPHSIYVQALSETGLVGSVPMLMIWFFFLRVNSRTRKHLKALGMAHRKSFEYRVSIGLDLAFVGYMVSGAFITVLYYPHLWYLLGLNVALHNICLRKQPEIAPAESRVPLKRFALAAR
jgi:putative inorganic carbon (hco3(-)) transporter